MCDPSDHASPGGQDLARCGVVCHDFIYAFCHQSRNFHATAHRLRQRSPDGHVQNLPHTASTAVSGWQTKLKKRPDVLKEVPCCTDFINCTSYSTSLQERDTPGSEFARAIQREGGVRGRWTMKNEADGRRRREASLFVMLSISHMPDALE